MTTFSRLALVIQGKIKPCNWIERAFAALAEAASGVLPSISNADRGKFLGVNSSNNNLGWKAIRQVPDVENADKGKYLHANGDTGALEWSEAGGSSGLPSYTNSDIGKTLNVVNATTETTLVDEQTITFTDGSGELAANTNHYNSATMKDGAAVTIIVSESTNANGTYTTVIGNFNDIRSCNFGDGFFIILSGPMAGMVSIGEEASAKISATVMAESGGADIGWKAAKEPDIFVVKATSKNSSIVAENAATVFYDINDALANGKAVFLEYYESSPGSSNGVTVPLTSYFNDERIKTCSFANTYMYPESGSSDEYVIICNNYSVATDGTITYNQYMGHFYTTSHT